MEVLTVFAMVAGLVLTALTILVALYIAQRQGAFRNESLFITVAVPKLLPLNSAKPRFGRMLGPPGSQRLGSVYPILMKPPPCIAISIPGNADKVIFFLPIAVCNFGQKSSSEVELHLVTSSNLAAENVTELGKIKGISTERRQIDDLGELQVSHSLGTIKKNDHSLIGEVFALDLKKHEVGKQVIRATLNIAAHSEGSYANIQIIVFLLNAESQEDLMAQLGYQANMEYKKNTGIVRRVFALGRAFRGRPCMWVFPGYKSTADDVTLHQFDRAGDQTEAGLLVPVLFGRYISL